ncbi:hypothetical protein Ae201684P_007282 [Aphanomyces euteiches]|nr:hypothetical protein Ae201684P_007282 [Aphanomyces euteiches]
MDVIHFFQVFRPGSDRLQVSSPSCLVTTIMPKTESLFVLHEAVRNGDLDGMVKGLLTSNTKIDGIHEQPTVACGVRKWTFGRDQVSPRQRRCDKYNWTIGPRYILRPIMATKNGHLDVVKYLLDKGAAVDIKESTGWTPLQMASASGRLDVVKYLLDKGAALDTKNPACPFHMACESGHLDVVKCLLDKGTAIDEASHHGQTPLYLASKYGYLDVVKYLVEKGAAVDTKDIDGWTPLHMACENGHFDIVKYLFDNGAALDTKSHHSQTPLHKASASVALNAESQQGRTPLHLASENGCVDIVKYLLEQGATINSRDNNGWTSLHCAFNSRNEKVVLMLLDAGFDVNLKTKDAKSVRDLCSGGSLLALLDKLDWIRWCFGNAMVPTLQKNEDC